MDFIIALDRGNNRAMADSIATYLLANPHTLEEFMPCFFSDDIKIAQRAAYVLGVLAETDTQILQPYLSQCISHMQMPGLHQATIRNMLKLLQCTDAPEGEQGLLIDLCMQYIADAAQPIAIKAYAITVMERIAKVYPELLTELMEILRDRLPYESPAFKVRAKRIFKSAGQAWPDTIR